MNVSLRTLVVAVVGGAALWGAVAVVADPVPGPIEQARLVARGGVGSITVEGPPGTKVYLRPASLSSDAAGLDAAKVDGGTLDALGGLHFPTDRLSVPEYGAKLAPGLYELWQGETPSAASYAATVVVRGDDPNPYASQDLLAQSWPVGEDERDRVGYVATRDGTLLSFHLRLPVLEESCDPFAENAAAVASCDIPSILEYSVYDPSDPNAQTPLDGERQLERGYALLAVNARGTGCSGGALLPLLGNPEEARDGYDLVETLAAQPWTNGKVGMTGTSYHGVSQVVVASTNPPSLKAITPAAVPNDMYEAAHPGGVPSGYFDYWAAATKLGSLPPSATQAERDGLADIPGLPAAMIEGLKQPNWIYHRAVGGDRTCSANTATRRQWVDIAGIARNNPFQGGDGDPWSTLDLASFFAEVRVPALVIQGLGDEHEHLGFDRLLGTELSERSTLTRLVTGNGDHMVSSSREANAERDAFLDLLVDDTLPSGCVPKVYNGSTDVGDAIDALGTTSAVVYWDQQWDGFANQVHPDAIDTTPCTSARFSSDLATWPIEASTPTTYQFDDDGSMSATEPPGADGTVTYVNNLREDAEDATGLVPQAMPLRTESATFTTGPFTQTTPLLGPASADLVVSGVQPTVDLEVTLTDVYPDGREAIIESGWRRTCVPEAEGGTALRPVLDLTVSTSSCSPTACDATCIATPQRVRVPISSFAHVMRPDHRLRVRVSAPGYAGLIFRFRDAIDGGSSSDTVTIHTDETFDRNEAVGSALVVSPFPVGNLEPVSATPAPNVNVAPPCGALGGSACFRSDVSRVVATPLGEDGLVHVDWDTLDQPTITSGYDVFMDDGDEPVAQVRSTGRLGAYEGALVQVPDDGQTHTFTVAATGSWGSLGRSGPSNAVSYVDDADDPGDDLMDGRPAADNESTLAWTDLSGGSVALTTDDPRSGLQSAAWTPGADGILDVVSPGTDFSEVFEVEGGDVYHAEVWLRGGATADVTAGLSVVWWGADLTMTSVEGVDLEQDGDWTKVSITAKAPPDAIFAIPMIMAIDPDIAANPSTAYTINIDDLRFCEGTSCT